MFCFTAATLGLTIGSTVSFYGKDNVQILELVGEPEPEPEPEPASVEQFYVYQSTAAAEKAVYSF